MLRDEVRRDMRKSTPDFLYRVWPVLKTNCKELQGGELRPVEGKDDELCFDLDIRAGIDAYQRWGYAMRGIACRVQWRKDYRSFTIRTSRPSGAETELQKRLAVLKRRDEGFFYPYWTIQAYLDRPGGNLLSVGVAKTAELYLWIEHYEKHIEPLPRKNASEGGEGFLYVEWDLYRLSGHYFFEYPRRSLAQRIDALIEALPEGEETAEEEVYLSKEYIDPEMQKAEELLTERSINALIEWVENEAKRDE